jgi:hypothetical protein
LEYRWRRDVPSRRDVQNPRQQHAVVNDDDSRHVPELTLWQNFTWNQMAFCPKELVESYLNKLRAYRMARRFPDLDFTLLTFLAERHPKAFRKLERRSRDPKVV